MRLYPECALQPLRGQDFKGFTKRHQAATFKNRQAITAQGLIEVVHGDQGGHGQGMYGF